MQGYCARRKAPDFQCAIIARRSFRALEMETDLVCWNAERCASFTTRQGAGGEADFELLARRLGGDSLLKRIPVFSVLFSDGQHSVDPHRANSSGGRSMSCVFDWSEALSLHAGRADGVVCDIYNLMGDQVRILLLYHTHTHTHARRTHAHTHTHGRTHTQTQTQTLTYAHARTHALTHTN
jgi:hypothetical protein